MYLLFFLYTANCIAFTDDDTSKVKGGYRKSTLYTYGNKLGEINQKSKNLEKVIKYNSKGYITEVISYEENKIVRKEEYKRKDNKITEIFLYIYPENEIASITKFKYDQNGNLIDERVYNYKSGTNLYGFSYEYNSNGQLIETKFSLGNIRQFKYNVRGLLYLSIDIGNDVVDNSSVELKDSTIYIYNDIGQLIKNEFKYDNKPPYYEMYKKMYKYDLNGNCIEEKYFHFDNSFSRYTNKYDKYGNIIEIIKYENHEISSKNEYIYSK